MRNWERQNGAISRFIFSLFRKNDVICNYVQCCSKTRRREREREGRAILVWRPPSSQVLMMALGHGWQQRAQALSLLSLFLNREA